MISVFLKSILVYVILMALMRLIGKRQLGELEPSELVVTILISEAAAQPVANPDASLTVSLVAVLTLMGMEYLMSLLSLKSVKFRAFLAGKPSLLVVHGRIDQSQMRRNRITPDELAEAMRQNGITDLNAVEYAVLETSGQVSVISTPEETAVTAGQMGIDAADAGYAVIVINCGRVLKDNLQLLGLDENWLRARLRENGLSDPSEVYMMTADMAGGIFLAPLEN